MDGRSVGRHCNTYQIVHAALNSRAFRKQVRPFTDFGGVHNAYKKQNAQLSPSKIIFRRVLINCPVEPEIFFPKLGSTTPFDECDP
jgi:hypothetical protein